jgi:hypothetical protein
LTTHSQHFTITRESGIHNRQSYEWQKDIAIDTSSNYLLMFTMNRYYSGKDVCTEMETFNIDGVSTGKESAYGPGAGSGVLYNATSRSIHYGSKTSGVSSYALYDLCNVEEFGDNKATIVDLWVSIRNSDNKLYVRFKSANGNNQVAEGEVWTLDVAYGIDYVNPNPNN